MLHSTSSRVTRDKEILWVSGTLLKSTVRTRKILCFRSIRTNRILRSRPIRTNRILRSRLIRTRTTPRLRSVRTSRILRSRLIRTLRLRSIRTNRILPSRPIRTWTTKWFRPIRTRTIKCSRRKIQCFRPINNRIISRCKQIRTRNLKLLLPLRKGRIIKFSRINLLVNLEFKNNRWILAVFRITRSHL